MEIELYIRKQTCGYWEREGRLNWEVGIDMYTLCVCVCVCVVRMLSRFSHVQLCGTLWTVAHQAPLSMEFSQARILEWVAMHSSRGYSQARD